MQAEIRARRNKKFPEEALGHLIKAIQRSAPPPNFEPVAASASERTANGSLALAVTPRPSRSKLRGIGPIANKMAGPRAPHARIRTEAGDERNVPA